MPVAHIPRVSGTLQARRV